MSLGTEGPMRRPTFAVISALVVACGSSSTTSGVSDSGGGDDGSGSGGSGGGSGTSGSSAGGSGSSSGSSSGSTSASGSSSGSSASGSSGSGSSSGSSSGTDAGIEGGASGCPSSLPPTGTACAGTDAGTCSYSIGTMGGASCSCRADEGGFAWNCLYTAGRRPERWTPAVRADRPSVAAHLATAAQLEGASVMAFRILRHELRAHGAPRCLLRRASRAACEERRHARRVGALARRWGAQAPSPEVTRRAVRGLLDVAVENAVEGSVRETFGALVAAWQASHANDRGVRATMRDIARDETRHAALSWDVAQWAERRLSAGERRKVATARKQAIETLRAEVGVEPPRELVETLGVPTAEQAGRLLDGMVRVLGCGQCTNTAGAAPART